MKKNRLQWLLLTGLVFLQTGCATLGQFAGKDADIRGRVIMPDGVPAKDVDLLVSHKKIVEEGFMGPTGKDFWEKIHSQDGTFHVRYSGVFGVTIRALKQGYRSNRYELTYEDKLAVDGLIVELVETGEPVARSDLYNGMFEITLKPGMREGGIKFRRMTFLKSKEVVLPDEADFYFQRGSIQGDDGREIHGITLKLREGFEIQPYRTKQPVSDKARIFFDAFPLVPKDGYERREFWLPFGAKENRASFCIRTPDGKYGMLHVFDWQLRGTGDESAVEVKLRYEVQPDGTRNMDFWYPPEGFDERGKPIKQP